MSRNGYKSARPQPVVKAAYLSHEPRLPDPSPALVAESLDRVHFAVQNPDRGAQPLHASLCALHSHLSPDSVADSCWSVLADSEIISDLLYCVRPIVEIEILDQALRILLLLFSHSPAALESFVSNGGTPAILDRVRETQHRAILRGALSLLSHWPRAGLSRALTDDPDWFSRYLAIPHCVSDAAMLRAWSEFLESAFCLFPGHSAKLWRRSLRLFDFSVRSRAREWKVIQRLLLEQFELVLRNFPDPYTCFASGVTGALLRAFPRLPQSNQIPAARALTACFPPGVPPNVFLSSALSASLDFAPFMAALQTANTELKESVLGMLDAVFAYNGDLCEPAIACGLPAVLAELASQSFAVKAGALRLIRTVILNCTSDCDREPFLARELLELAVVMADDSDAREVVDALWRTFGAEYPALAQMLEAVT